MQTDKGNDIIVDTIMRWIFFGVLVSAAPAFGTVLFRVIAGEEVLYIDYFSDILLTIIAVGCNFINLCIDEAISLSKLFKWLFVAPTGSVSILCFAAYILYYFSPDFFSKPLFMNTNLAIFFKISCGIIILCLVVGIGLQLKAYFRDKKGNADVNN